MIILITVIFCLSQSLAVRQGNAPWHLARLSAKEAWPQPQPYVYDYYTTQSRVIVYLLDTGIDINNPEFEGRAKDGNYYYGRSERDDNGRGTHLAGLIASRTYGVAKNVTLVSVKIHSARGTGRVDEAVQGLQWARHNTADKSHTVVCIPSAYYYSEYFNAALNSVRHLMTTLITF